MTREIYGQRGRIGLIVPSSNTTMEMDYHRLIPEGVSVHTARIRFTGASSMEDLTTLLKNAGKAVSELLDCRPDVVVWGCTAASAAPGVDEEVRRVIEVDHKVPCVMPLAAAVSAFRSLDVSRVSVAAPYTEEILEGVRRYLEGKGIKVAKVRGLGLSDNHSIAAQTPQIIYELVHSADSSDAEGVFISCTNLRAIDLIERLEKDLGKVVVSSNQAGLWAALRKIGVEEPISGYGKLLNLR